MLLPLLMLLAAEPSSAADFWTDVPAAAQRRLGKPRLQPTRYRVLQLDFAAAQRYLRQVPSEGSAPTLLTLPLPDGSRRHFRMRRTTVMHPALAARYPDIQTFGGQDAADPTSDLRLELTPTGLRAQLIGSGGTVLIEPYKAADTRHYICFDKASLPPGSKQWQEPAPKD
jgi:hypothetical protein